MEQYNKAMTAYNVIAAFQHFAGKPLRALDAVEDLPDADILAMVRILRNIASNLRTESETDWPELHRLAERIEAKFKPASE